MGYEETRFVGEIDQEFMCSICRMVLEDAMQSPCDHLFCKQCIVPWLAADTSCPVDRRTLQVAALKPVARFFQNVLAKLMIKCDFEQQGCANVVHLGQLQSHLLECTRNPNAEVVCDKGCNMTMRRHEYEMNDCLTHFSSRLTEKDLEIARLNALGNCLQENNQHMNDELNRQREENRQTNVDNRRLQEENQHMNDELYRQRKENRQINDANRRLQEENQHMNDELNRQREENRQTNVDNRRLQEENQHMNGELNRQREENRQINDANRRLQEDNQHMNDGLNRQREENRQTNDANRRLQEDNQHMNAELNRQREENRQTNVANRRLKEENQHMNDELKRQREENRQTNVDNRRLQEENQHMNDELKRQQEENRQTNDVNRRLQLQINHTPLIWHRRENINFTGDTHNILEGKDRVRSGFAQLFFSIESNFFFRVQILDWHSNSWMVIGLHHKDYPICNFFGGSNISIGYSSYGTIQNDSEAEKVVASWKNGDTIQCGIKISEYTYNKGENFNVVIFLQNDKLIVKKRIEMPTDGLYPTICMYNCKIKYLI